MKTKQLDYIYQYLEEDRFKSFFDLIVPILRKKSDDSLISKAEQCETNYRFLLKYMSQGVVDPKQKEVLDLLRQECFSLADFVCESLSIEQLSSFLYQKKLRVEAEYHGQLKLFLSRLSALDTTDLSQRKQYEKEMIALFDFILFLKDDQVDDLKSFFSSERICVEDKALLVSAIGFRLMRSFSEPIFSFLLWLMQSPENKIRLRALTLFVPLYIRYLNRIGYSKKISEIIAILCVDKQFVDQIKVIILQYIRTMETKSITDKINNELIPEMKKMTPQWNETTIDLASVEDLEDMMNPEWKNQLKDSSLMDKIQEFGELQQEGADVYLSSFANMKSFSFFYEMANWFRPFSVDFSEVATLFTEKDKGLFHNLLSMSGMCNSDAYSFCFGMIQFFPEQREAIAKAYAQQGEQLNELKKEDELLNRKIKDEDISNAYIQDLYRFFHLFSHKEDFFSLFEYVDQLGNEVFLQTLGLSVEEQLMIAEYYFSKKGFKEALALFRLNQKNKISVEMSQKMGYCAERMKNFQEAYNFYEEADIIEGHNRWTLKRLSIVAEKLGYTVEAIRYLRQLLDLSPEEEKLQFRLATLLLNENIVDEALILLNKIEYHSPSQPKVLRALVNANIQKENYVQALRLLRKLQSMSIATTSDFVLMGLLLLAEENWAEAMDSFSMSVQELSVSFDEYEQLFRREASVILKNFDRQQISLLLDSIFYNNLN